VGIPIGAFDRLTSSAIYEVPFWDDPKFMLQKRR
jgi:hypothetical protein